jgi:histidine triad (HIT) family protein
MTNCTFCDLVAGHGAISPVYEDDRVLAFLDIAPANLGHTLVIPKQHFSQLADMDEATGMHLFKVTQRVAQAVRRSGVRCEGVNLLLADGAAASQEVFHVHMHVVPRFAGDDFKIEAGWNIQPCRTEMNEIAAQIGKSYMQLWLAADDRRQTTDDGR